MDAKLSRLRRRFYPIAGLADCTNSLFVFTLTRHLAERDGDLVHAGILGACNSLSYALAAAGCGHASDRFGRRRLIVAGALLCILSCALPLHSMAVPFIYAVATLEGVAVAMIFPPLIAILSSGRSAVGDRSPSATRPLLTFCLAWNAGVIAGHFGGGQLFPLGSHWALLSAIFLSLLVLLVLATARGPLPVAAALERMETPPDWARLRFFAAVGWLANTAGAFCVSLVQYIFPQLVANLGIGAPVHGAMLVVMRASVVAMYCLLHFTSFWRHRLLPMLAVQMLAVLGLWILASADGVVWLTVGLMLVGAMMGSNYFASIFYSTTSFGDAKKGLASGLHEAALAMGFVVGALGGGYLGAQLGVRMPFLVCIGVVGVFALLQGVGYGWFRRGMK